MVHTTRSLGILKAVVIAIACSITILLFLRSVIEIQEEKVNESEATTFVITSKRFSEENKTLTVYLQNLGGPLDYLSASDFSWYLNNEFMGSAYSISLHHPDGTLRKGETMQVDLKAGELSSGDKIILVFRGVHRIVFTL